MRHDPVISCAHIHPKGRHCIQHLIVLRVAANLFVGFTIYMKIGLKYKHALNAQVLMVYSSMVFEDKSSLSRDVLLLGRVRGKIKTLVLTY